MYIQWMKLTAVAFVVIVLFGIVFLAGSGANAIRASGSPEAAPARTDRRSDTRPAVPVLATGQGTLRTASAALVLHHTPDDLAANMMSGGPPPDGIPSIDDPKFVPADRAGLDRGDMIVGLDYGGTVRAYPHRILVHHEIVNHRIGGPEEGGENIAVTYCPLTATAQAFRTGTTTLGVSGRLINSNLVMYDRDTGSLWPQIAATAIAGERRGESLDEINVTWTTWGAWVDRHPETEVLSTDTGYLRNYDRDPYGSYNPAGGYYTMDRTMFPVMHEDDRYHPKHMVVGARTTAHAVFFDLEALRRQGLQETERFIGVYDPDLRTAYIYEKDGAFDGTYEEGQIVARGGGDTYRADELPLEQVVAIEAFAFAWIAFYPDSEHPR